MDPFLSLFVIHYIKDVDPNSLSIIKYWYKLKGKADFNQHLLFILQEITLLSYFPDES